MALADEGEVPRRLAAVVIVLAATTPARILDDQELLVVFFDGEGCEVAEAEEGGPLT